MLLPNFIGCLKSGFQKMQKILVHSGSFIYNIRHSSHYGILMKKLCVSNLHIHILNRFLAYIRNLIELP